MKFKKIRSLPIKTQRLVGLGIVFALALSLPLFIWAVVNQRFLIIKHAQTLEPTPSGNPLENPQASPSANAQILSFLIKFAGVTGENAQDANVKVSLKSDAGIMESAPIAANYQGGGIYKITIAISDPLPNGTYPLFVKGEKQLGVRFCTIGSVLTRCPTTAQATDGIQIKAKGATFDLTAYPLVPGDLPPQDGKSDSGDLAKFSDLMKKPVSSLTDADKLIGDLNYDGYINAKDAFLLNKAMGSQDDNF